MSNETAGLLRVRNGHAHGRVTFVELFFDLVFVFAITQLSHSLVHHLSLQGLAQTTLLMMAVWWVWIDTSWCTNWLDPAKAPVRLLLFALMLGGLVLSSSIPQAFDTRGLAFAFALASIQVGRCLFMLWALKVPSPGNYRNFQRITAWLALAAVVWIAGGFAEGGTRLALWTVALLIETTAPAVGFWVAGWGARRRRTGTSKAATWPSAAGCSSSLPWASRSWSRAASSRASPGRRRRSRPSWWPLWAA
jgi:low temperature requirement protein LtrA